MEIIKIIKEPVEIYYDSRSGDKGMESIISINGLEILISAEETENEGVEFTFLDNLEKKYLKNSSSEGFSIFTDKAADEKILEILNKLGYATLTGELNEGDELNSDEVLAWGDFGYYS